MKIIFYFILSIIIFNSEIAVAREAYIDQKESCEKQNGLWREFGNDCAGECYAQGEKLAICAAAITFSCDCGVGRCLENGECTNTQKYLEKVVQMKKEDEERKLALEEKAKKLAENKKPVEENKNEKQKTDIEVNSQVNNVVEDVANKAKSSVNDAVSTVSSAAQNVIAQPVLSAEAQAKIDADRAKNQALAAELMNKMGNFKQQGQPNLNPNPNPNAPNQPPPHR